MRSELEQLEQIDLYLGGKMSTEQLTAFETEMASNPQLKSMVEDQQLLIQTVSRKALMAEINAVAGAAGATGAAGGTAWGISQWLITIASIVTVGVGSFLIYNHTTTNDEETVAENTEEIVDESDNVIEKDVIMDSSELFSFAMDTETEVITTSDDSDEEKENPFEDYEDKVTESSGLLLNLNESEGDEIIEQEEDNDLKSTKQQSFQGNGATNVLQKTSTKKKTNLKASFPGGRKELKRFFKKNLRYPRTPYDKGISGTVKVTFVVSADGILNNIESDCYIMFDENGKPLTSGKMLANKKSKSYFEENAERVFRISSPWEPATDSEGNPILSLQTWFVKYKLNGESEVYPSLEGTESSQLEGIVFSLEK
jgi:hypothetical protein